MEIVIFIVLIVVGYLNGTWVEKKHYKSIAVRELALCKLPVVTDKNLYDKSKEVIGARLVMGNAVISIDYFKRVLAGLRCLVGGELSSYETLLDRARREAIIRMKEKAKGANIILNLRLETSSIGYNANQKKSLGSVEVIAYGTALRFNE